MLYDTADYRPSSAKPHYADELPPTITTDLEHRRWDANARRLDERDAKARSEASPGTKFFVQTKALPVRRRAGIAFSNKARVPVEVVDATDEEVAAKVLAGATVVTPLGALAIVEDDALIVYKDNAPTADGGRTAELEAQNADLTAQLADAQAQLAALRKPSADGSDGTVKSDRLAAKKAAAPAQPPATDTTTVDGPKVPPTK